MRRGAARRHPLLRACARLPVREIPLQRRTCRKARRAAKAWRNFSMLAACAFSMRWTRLRPVTRRRPRRSRWPGCWRGPSITAPIVSATSLPQLAELLKAPEIRLSGEDVAALNAKRRGKRRSFAQRLKDLLGRRRNVGHVDRHRLELTFVDHASKPDLHRNIKLWFRTSTCPVSSSDLRLDRIFGQPPDTALISLSPSP